MRQSRRCQVHLSGRAEDDYSHIMEWTVEEFGLDAAERYENLIGQAMIDLSEDPFRAGSKERREIFQGILTYHLSNSRDRVAGDRVKTPRHFVVYRVADLSVQVLRILHDSRDLVRHVMQD